MELASGLKYNGRNNGAKVQQKKKKLISRDSFIAIIFSFPLPSSCSSRHGHCIPTPRHYFLWMASLIKQWVHSTNSSLKIKLKCIRPDLLSHRFLCALKVNIDLLLTMEFICLNTNSSKSQKYQRSERQYLNHNSIVIWFFSVYRSMATFHERGIHHMH